ncbi:MAG TPA: GDP-L-fucose synthase [bacterium]|nr:GDP-L-fucose synthase [bacterium]
MNLSDKKIYIAGHTGLVGSALLRLLTARGCSRIITRAFAELDLRRQQDVEAFFDQERPEVVVIAAAKVGGILANDTYRAEFIYDNLLIAANLIHSAYQYGVEKLLFLGSSCIYPKLAPQPLKEEYLLTGPLEPTNEPYAVAKIAGLKLCENYYRQYGCNFLSLMPTNLYGPADNFDLETSHVLPALIRKFHEAKIGRLPSVQIWGSGRSRREFLFVDDLADAIMFVLQNVQARDLYSQGISHLNVGTGEDLAVKELAQVIAEVVGYDGELIYDRSKPDGTPQKLLDVTRMHELGWQHRIPLRDGIEQTYQWYCTQVVSPQ